MVLLLSTRVVHGVCCQHSLLAPTICKLELVATVVKTVVAMASETEAVAWQQEEKGSSGGSRNVGGGGGV